ncbi:cytochrome o ubiquinol oxidase subunit IV [Aureimonas endophytica]|uniref:Cytochrome bo(3) ubiquinol oxidase subunit 4 n=1 Tax=Aureimonas endophytica TaxID=2027858 RepID=A0A916ZIL9_9HYPH|nr:cytochrome o ubiquinol oxidase subunit IV [Aureimonas endophytica]GGD99413.1 cytochrome o ubiquinol oxidase subunit IV [Aureimonas endophytica]
MNTSTTSEYDPHGKDVAPGDDSAEHGSLRDGIVNYVIGLAFAGILTTASFLVAGSGSIYGPGVPVAILVLAVAQMGVHLVFFLHITTGPDNTNNVLALAFGVLIVVLIVAGSLWIMANLHQNMVPANPMGAIYNAPL